MKHLFAIIAAVLVLSSIAIALSMPGVQSDVPVIYWVTDPNPARVDQAGGFEDWLIKNGHVTEDGKPVVELKLDFSNNANEKKIIQGVSGVGSALFDQTSGTLHFAQAVGIAADVTERARELGFGPEQTYPEIVPDITVDGRQYAFPCIVSVGMYFANKATFEKYGVEVPPERWDTDTFERIGKQLVDAANKPGERRTVFLMDDIRTIDLHRSAGLSIFNETLTRCTINDPRYIRVLRLKHKWMYEDHLIPSLAEQSGFDTASGFGGPRLQLFGRGNYAMIGGGRWLLIQLRKFGEMQLDVSENPHLPGGMPNTTFYTRCATVYKGAEHRDKAELFLAYLASEAYNRQIIKDADALPPNPRYADTEAFHNPPDYPNEHGIHEPFYNAAMNIAIAVPASPFVLKSVHGRHIKEAEDAFMNDRMGAEEAAVQAAERINAEIIRTLQEQPKLRPEYDRRVATQEKIDALRAAGEPVPVEWIDNPFHRKWYAYNGWLAEPEPAAAKGGD